MKKSAKGRNFVYPNETKRSRIAARIRKEANALTDQERTDLLKRGMQIIYGGASAKETGRSG